MSTKLKNDNTVLIGSNMRRIRLGKGMKQIELVKLLQLRGFNVCKETIVKLEHNRQHFDAGLFKAVAEILDTTYEELLR